MRTPQFNMNLFKERRQKLAQLIQGSALVLPAHPEQIRNFDVHHPYRQDSNLFYLTGFEEPESILVFRPGKKPETVLFVRDKNVERETWDGFRYGPQAAAEKFFIDEVHSVSKFEEIAVSLLQEVEKIYYTLFKDDEFDKVFARVLHGVKTKKRRSGKGLLPIYDAYPLLGELRVKKSAEELAVLRRACEITADAHLAVMKQVKPGMNEREVHGLFVYEAFKRGAQREGYGTIVASGANATTLHYVFNDQVLKAGDFLLIDAGAEYQYYTGDITRTYPVGGRFSEAQRRLYGKLLKVQKELIQMVKPGLPFQKLQETTIASLVDVMLEERLLTGNKAQLIESQAYTKYYPHSVSHYLGMDVHDAGMYEVNGQSRILESGIVFTIEPGIYIPYNDSTAPAELRGLGIRIEDNILVTETGHEVLTSGAPKEIAELEDLIGI